MAVLAEDLCTALLLACGGCVQKIHHDGDRGQCKAEVLCVHKINKSEAAGQVAIQCIHRVGCKELLDMSLGMLAGCKNLMKLAAFPNASDNVAKLVMGFLSA